MSRAWGVRFDIGTPDGAGGPANWQVVEEVALQLLLDGTAFGVMMVSPHDVEDFVHGFCLTEQILQRHEISDIVIEQGEKGLLVNVKTRTGNWGTNNEGPRALPARSSCGICGAQTLADALPKLPRVSAPSVTPASIMTGFDNLAAQQVMRAVDHSSHGAALCNQDGQVLLLREDVGRHNALDKLVGAMAVTNVSPGEGFAVLSSRLSVEMVQKAAMAGFGVVACLSAPTSLALTRAKECGMAIYCRSDHGIMAFGGV